MKTVITTTLLLLIILLASPALAQPIDVKTTDGGSVATELGYGIKINKNSTLRRSWVVLNDPSCPIQLFNAGINTQYSDSNYNYVPTGSVKTSKAITALEIRYLLYDVFGNHMKTLSITEVADVAAKAEVQLKDIGSWRAWVCRIANYDNFSRRNWVTLFPVYG